MALMKIQTRYLEESDFKIMKKILFSEGTNDWNYITEDSINSQFQLIRQHKALAVLAENKFIAGFAILILKNACPLRLSKYSNLTTIAYIDDVVVSADQCSKGIGSMLLQKAVELARKEKCREVYIERHEENMASAGMMRKAGFELIETFHDPNKRTTGSKNTSVLKKYT